MFVTEKQKRKIRKVAWETGPEAALELANRLINGHGVEAIYDGNYSAIYPAYFYVNMGDPYRATVIYDVRAGRFLWGACWGDLVERLG